MSKSHAELALLRDREDWNALWPEAESRANFSIEQVARGATDKDSPNYDPDIAQVGHEAAFLALKDWEPIAYALDTHVKMRVQSAVRDYQLECKTGGIGSEWTARQGDAAEHTSMYTEAGFDEEGGDLPTYMDELTYGDTDNVPAGYGSIEQELAGESMAEAIAFYMHGLTPDEAHLVRAYIMGEATKFEFEMETGMAAGSVHHAAEKILKKISRKAKTSVVLDMGGDKWKQLKSHFPVRKRYPAFWSDAEGMFTANPIWSEATGRVWNSWEWKPLLGDVPDLTVLRAFERAAHKRAA